jgi:hypothetical protein
VEESPFPCSGGTSPVGGCARLHGCAEVVCFVLAAEGGLRDFLFSFGGFFHADGVVLSLQRITHGLCSGAEFCRVRREGGGSAETVHTSREGVGAGGLLGEWFINEIAKSACGEKRRERGSRRVLRIAVVLFGSVKKITHCIIEIGICGEDGVVGRLGFLRLNKYLCPPSPSLHLRRVSM